MSAFSTILSKYFPNIDITEPAFIYPNKERILINKDFTAYGFVNSIHSNLLNHRKSKFEILQFSIVDNLFVAKNIKQHYEYIFSCAQRTYFAFCRLARSFKVKKSLHYNMKTDLCMTPLSKFKSSVKIDLYDDRTKTIYYFRLSDLLNIIQTALSNSPEFFSEPLPIKNPYTNIKFTHAQLYTIYFKIRESQIHMPILFQQYLSCNFNLNLFSKYNECYIRDISIKQFSKDATGEQKFKYIMKMLREYNNCMKGMVIHREFKRKYILKAFEKYIYNYLIISYTLNPTLRYITREKLRRDLTRFNKLNPTFGRKIYYNIKRNATNTRNIPYQFRFDSDSAPIVNTNSSQPLNFRNTFHNVSLSIQNEITEIISNIDNSNIPQHNIGIHFVSHINNDSPYNFNTNSESSITVSNSFFDEAVNVDPLENINSNNYSSEEEEYSEVDEMEDDSDTEETIPTYNISLPNIQRVVLFNQDSVGYISNENIVENENTTINNEINILTTTNTAPPLPYPPPPPPIQYPPPPPQSLLPTINNIDNMHTDNMQTENMQTDNMQTDNMQTDNMQTDNMQPENMHNINNIDDVDNPVAIDSSDNIPIIENSQYAIYRV